MARKMAKRGSLSNFVDLALNYQGNDCLMWPYAKNRQGYGYVKVNGKDVSVHRLICRRAHGDPPVESMHAAHSCGRGSLGCVNPRHLRWATRLENDSDKDKHGTRLRGEKSPVSKLKLSDVRKIREFYAENYVSPNIASKIFGTCATNIRQIISGATWKDDYDARQALGK